MEITTLEQAARHLIESGSVNMDDMTVEGKQLLEVCGLDLDRAAQSITRQIERHQLVEGKDFCTSMCKSSGGRPATVYHFSLNAANHILLAAMTDKGKAARQDAINLRTAVDSIPADLLENMMAAFADRLAERAGGEIAKLAQTYNAKLQEKDELIIKKSKPSSLTSLVGRSAVRNANQWLEEHGYQQHYYDGFYKMWSLSDKGRELGTQVSKGGILWVPEILQLLPEAYR